MSANVYIIAGPNGAGKTTFAREFLPNYAHCPNFVNADLIAARLSPKAPERVAIAAGRLMLEEIETFAEQRADFGFETTLAGRGHLNLIRDLKRKGYEVHLYYLWLPGVDLAISRVRERVFRGGHDIPETVVRRRFERSIGNFLRSYRKLAEKWVLFDNSEAEFRTIATMDQGGLHLTDAKLYNKIVGSYGREAAES